MVEGSSKAERILAAERFATGQGNLFKPARKLLLESIGLKTGMILVDVGCGFGILTFDLAKYIYPSGKVIGFDIKRDILRRGREKASASKYAKNVNFKYGNIFSLPLPDDYADGCFCSLVLYLLKNNPLDAIREMARVTKPGGMVVAVSEPDYGTVIYPSTIKVSKPCLINAFSDFADPYFGRKLPQLFIKAGLAKIDFRLFVNPQANLIKLSKDFSKVEAWEITRTTGRPYRQVVKELEKQSTEIPGFFYYNLCFSIIGRKI